MMSSSSSSRPLRVYEAAWLQLRQHKHVVLTVTHETFMPRIKRMISKEKDMDDCFALLNDLHKPRLYFTWKPEEHKLYIELKTRFDLGEIN
jgi:hypothetical protein